jgi:uncharacterized Fe-S cluster-containing MiaB family protein
MKLKNNSKVSNFVGGLIIKSCLQIKEINNFESQKLNQEITEAVAKYIEQEIFHDGTIDGSTLNKREIIKEVLKQCYNLVEEDLVIIDSQLDYLIENKIIKKKGVFYRIYLVLKHLFILSRKA